MVRLLRQLRPPPGLARWRWHCLGLAFLAMELAFLAWVLMRQPSPPEPSLPPPAESIGIIPTATGTPPPSPSRPLPRLNPATPQLFIPTLAGRATPALPTSAPPATVTPAPVPPIVTVTPAVAIETPPATPAATPTPPPTATAAAPPPAAPTPIPTPTLTPAATPTPPPTPLSPLTAGIALLPESDIVAVGRPFQLRIWVYCGESNPVDAVQVYLIFDPARFAALSLTAGPDLEIPLQSNVDNALGRLDYAAGTLGAAVTNPFILATVTFRALAPTGPPGTYITFAALQSPRQTKAIAGGANLTGNLTSAYLVVE